MKGSNHQTNPLPVKPDFNDERETSKVSTNEKTLYVSLLADLRYLADSTWLDTAYAASRLARHSGTPTTKHMILL